MVTMKDSYNNWQIDKCIFTGSMANVFDKLGINAEIESVEKYDNTAAFWMDSFAGIDYMGKDDNNNIFGIASRIQELAPTSASYDSFTIRSDRHTGTKTEFTKRIEAIEQGFFYAQLTLQAYIQNGEVIAAAVIKTKDLFDFIKNHPYLVKHKFSDNKFKIVLWDDLIRADYQLQIYRK